MNLRSLGLAAVAASLIACNRNLPLEERTVTRDNASVIASQVRTSTLPSRDKAAFATFLFDNAKRPEAYEGKTVRGVINAERAHELGTRLERQDRESDAKRRASMAQFITLRVPSIRDIDGGVALQIDATNRSENPIDGFEAGLQVDDKATQHRIGLAELHIVHRLPAHAHASFTYPMRYVRFGEDTGSMRLARGKAKVVHLDPYAVHFTGFKSKDED